MKSPVYALWYALAEAGKSLADGFTIAAEILCPRDHTAEDRLRSWESAAEAVEDEICDEADRCEAAELTPELALGICPTWPCTPACHQSSAAVIAAADPSPVTAPTVGGEGPGPDSVIPQTVGPGRPNDDGDDPVCPCGCQTYRRSGKRSYAYMCDNHIYRCNRCGTPVFPMLQHDTDNCGRCTERAPVPLVVAGESPRGVSTDQPSLGEPRLDSELLYAAAAVIEMDGADMLAELAAELRDRAAQFEVFEREAAGE